MKVKSRAFATEVGRVDCGWDDSATASAAAAITDSVPRDEHDEIDSTAPA